MAPTQKQKSGSTNTNGRTAPGKSDEASRVPSSPAPKAAVAGVTERTPSSSSSTKPDKAAFEAEKARIQSEIDVIQAKVNAVRAKLSNVHKPDGPNDRVAALRAELDTIRGQQSGNKMSRGKIMERIKALQDNIQNQNKELQAARAKASFRTVAEVDAQIQNLRNQVDSGKMKLADEKHALQEISQLSRSRKTVESFQSKQDAIEEDRRAVDELRNQLDDPEAMALSNRYETIKAELDGLKKESDDIYVGRSKLIKERDELQAQLNDLYNKKREISQEFRDASDRFWNKIQEDRARRLERARAQKAEEEARQKLEIVERLREEAALPAYQTQIEDCQILIDALSGKTTSTAALSSASSSVKADLAGVPKLEPRKVEDVDQGLVVRKKKGEEEAYFVGKQRKGKKDKPTKSGNLNLSLPMLKALLSLSIPAPTGPDDVPRVIEDIKTKQAWFVANQKRGTAENMAKAEMEIQRLTSGIKLDTTPSRAESPPEDPNGEVESGTLDNSPVLESTVSTDDAVLEVEAEQ
ncbi:hypothetical protein BKA82DRAFT_13045 [Pisolithus tinctorius]|nr:hypothetical protein BKA82DRAFT_13045 [Pisolithus tinctorius]